MSAAPPKSRSAGPPPTRITVNEEASFLSSRGRTQRGVLVWVAVAAGLGVFAALALRQSPSPTATPVAALDSPADFYGSHLRLVEHPRSAEEKDSAAKDGAGPGLPAATIANETRYVLFDYAHAPILYTEDLLVPAEGVVQNLTSLPPPMAQA